MFMPRATRLSQTIQIQDVFCPWPPVWDLVQSIFRGSGNLPRNEWLKAATRETNKKTGSKIERRHQADQRFAIVHRTVTLVTD